MEPRRFVEMLREHDAAMRSLAHSIVGNAAGMDDVLQEAYTKAFVAWQTFRGDSSFRTWLYRIVHNAAIDEVRKQKKVIPIDDLLDGAHAPSVDVAQRLDVDQALAGLPVAQRIAVLLIDGEGFDYATAAEILDVPVGTVASRVHQARTSLRRLLKSSVEEGRS
jgi:RNA polymerase sigma-70 factor (ECF subfamily)